VGFGLTAIVIPNNQGKFYLKLDLADKRLEAMWHSMKIVKEGAKDYHMAKSLLISNGKREL